jgi:hypothetical protein
LSRSSASAFAISWLRFSAGVLQHRLAGVGQHQVLRRPVDQLLAQLKLQALQGQRNRRLRAQQLLGRARKALLGGDSEENVKRIKLHCVLLIIITYLYYEHYKFAKSGRHPDNWEYRWALREP